jgi:C-terminal processing protease CtpA/Prc
VQIGDLIKTINGINTQGLDLNTINGFFNSKPGKKVHLVVSRDGQPVKIDFKLADQI